jgi:hypothetical protein
MAQLPITVMATVKPPHSLAGESVTVLKEETTTQNGRIIGYRYLIRFANRVIGTMLNAWGQPVPVYCSFADQWVATRLLEFHL